MVAPTSKSLFTPDAIIYLNFNFWVIGANTFIHEKYKQAVKDGFFVFFK